LDRSLKCAYPLLKSAMQKLPSGPEDHAYNQPVENRVENDPRGDYRYANDGGFGEMFIPEVTHQGSIAVEMLEAGQVCVVSQSGLVQLRRNDV
jgi:hypothetical protein